MLTEEELLQITAKYKLIFLEAEKYGLSLSADELSQIREKEQNSYDKRQAENDEFAKSVGMTREEVIAMTVEVSRYMETKCRLAEHIFTSLFAGETIFKTEKIDSLLEKVYNLKDEEIFTSPYYLEIFDAYLESVFQNSDFRVLP